MSYLDRLAAIRRWQPEAYRPFLVGGRRVGRVRHETARLLDTFPDVFAVRDDAVQLSDDLTGVDDRSEAVHAAMQALAERGLVRPPRGETYGVAESWTAPDLLRIDRGYVPLFGTKAYGIHVNGFVRRDDGLHMWIGKRAQDKRVAPGKLDHLVAGGVAHGYSVTATLVKEAAEEASLPADLARQALPVGALSYVCEAESGLRDDGLFLFDLELPADFVPANTDGELQFFELWPIAAVLARVRGSDDFKFNVGPVIVDFALRRGLLRPDDEPDYLAIARALHGDGI